jgi:hypothetical protein
MFTVGILSYENRIPNTRYSPQLVEYSVQLRALPGLLLNTEETAPAALVIIVALSYNVTVVVSFRMGANDPRYITISGAGFREPADRRTRLFGSRFNGDDPTIVAVSILKISSG